MRKQLVIGTILVLLAGSALMFLLLPSAQPAPIESNDGRVSVVSSFYPLAAFSSRIGGDHVWVTTMTPAGAEPHDFEPTAKDIAGIFSADVFLYNGGGIDAWASKIAPEASEKGVATIDMSQHVGELLPIVEGGEDAAHFGEFETFDEHFWLAPRYAMREATVIRDALVTADAVNTGSYAANALTLIDELEKLSAEFKAGLADCKIRAVVTSHAAFGYLAQEYNFEMIPITISPEEEPSAGKLAEIARIAKQRGIKHIFFETLASPKLSETLASEIGAKTLVFNPLEGLTQEEISFGQDYFSIMRQNLENLRTAMVCK